MRGINRTGWRPGEKKCLAKYQQPTDSNSSAINPDRLTVTRFLMGHLGFVDDQAEAGLLLLCMVPKALQQLVTNFEDLYYT